MEASDFKVDAKTLDNQFASMKAAKEAQAAAKQSQAGPEQTAQAEQVVEAEAPAVG